MVLAFRTPQQVKCLEPLDLVEMQADIGFSKYLSWGRIRRYTVSYSRTARRLAQRLGRINRLHLPVTTFSHPKYTTCPKVSVRKEVESDESVVIQGMRPDSRRGRRCGRPQTARNTIVTNCAIRAT